MIYLSMLFSSTSFTHAKMCIEKVYSEQWKVNEKMNIGKLREYLGKTLYIKNLVSILRCFDLWYIQWYTLVSNIPSIGAENFMYIYWFLVEYICIHMQYLCYLWKYSYCWGNIALLLSLYICDCDKYCYLPECERTFRLF